MEPKLQDQQTELSTILMTVSRIMIDIAAVLEDGKVTLSDMPKLFDAIRESVGLFIQK
jgi:hypothetical protein